jgi:tetratricopeptide (TPR) repeat protein
MFRPLIWQDTLTLIRSAPWCGIGLENFTAIFPFYRSASVIQQSVLHPESDWLWLAAEAGWPALALALGGAAALLTDAFPFVRGSQRRLRTILLGAAVAAGLHAAIDVPEHRLGSAMVSLFALALARRGGAVEETDAAWRGASIASGLALLVASWIGLHRTNDAAIATTLLRHERFREAADSATKAVSRAPLDWTSYFTRGSALARSGSILLAVADFRRAKALEPHYAQVPFEEGRVWARRQPKLALEAWREALRRLKAPEDESLFSAILAAAPNTPAFRAQLLDLVRDRPNLVWQWFRLVPEDEATARIEEIAPVIQRLPAEQQQAFAKRREALEVRPR